MTRLLSRLESRPAISTAIEASGTRAIAPVLVGLVVFWVVVLVCAGPLFAGTAQDFDAPGDAYTLGEHGSPPGATVSAGGPTGNFLRLVPGSATNVVNTIGFDRTDAGSFCTVKPVKTTGGT